MNNYEQSEIWKLAQLSLNAVVSHSVDPYFPQLAEAVEDAIDALEDVELLVKLMHEKDPLLSQYLLRVIRTVSSEELVADDSMECRLVLFGVGLLLPKNFDFNSPEWACSLFTLEAGLATVWANEIYNVTVMPAAIPLSTLEQMPAREVRRGLMELHDAAWTSAFETGKGECPEDYDPFVLPLLVALAPELSREFIQEYLTPRGKTPLLGGVKHRVESNFDELKGLKPMFLAPCSWANVAPFVRAMHARQVIYTMVQSPALSKQSWSLRPSLGHLHLINEDPSYSKTLDFPEETLADITKLATGISTRAGIPMADES